MVHAEKEQAMNIDTSKVIGLEGGSDATWFKVLAESGRGEAKYYPAVVDGEIKSWVDFPNFDDYLAAKVERTRSIIRFTVAGNAVVAEDAISKLLDCKALAGSPTSVDVYPDEPLVDVPTAGAALRRVNSPKQQAAARTNGRKGGRPRKQTE